MNFFRFFRVDRGRFFSIGKGKIFGEEGRWVKIGYYLEIEVIGWVRDDLVWGD